MTNDDAIPSSPLGDQPYLDLENLQEIYGGYRIAENDTHYFDVYLMLFNWRVSLVPKAHPMLIDKSFCYKGTDQRSFLRAVAAAWLWYLEGGDEPKGWNKNVQTQEWRENPGAD